MFVIKTVQPAHALTVDQSTENRDLLAGTAWRHPVIAHRNQAGGHGASLFFGFTQGDVLRRFALFHHARDQLNQPGRTFILKRPDAKLLKQHHCIFFGIKQQDTDRLPALEKLTSERPHPFAVKAFMAEGELFHTEEPLICDFFCLHDDISGCHGRRENGHA